jgi:hypothetical protein
LYNARGEPILSSQRENAIAESWQRTLSAIPTLIGRMAYVASLRNANTGIYEHFGLAQRVGADEVDRTLRRSHMNLFVDWLSLALENQKDQLEEYFSDLDGDRRELISSWLAMQPWNGWAPAESRDVERKLFNADLAVILELLRTEYGVASRDPES